MSFFRNLGRTVANAAKKVGKEIEETAKDTGDFVVGIGKDSANAISKGSQNALDAVKAAGKATGAFLTKPLATYQLPNEAGYVKIWIGVYEIHLTKKAINEINNEKDIGYAVVGLVGAIVGATGGTLAPVAAILVAFIIAEWEIIKRVTNEHGVNFRGRYVPPTAEGLIPTPGNA